MSSGTENKAVQAVRAVQAVQAVRLAQVVWESRYHLDSVHAVKPVHSSPSPPQHDAFVYLAQLPPQDD